MLFSTENNMLIKKIALLPVENKENTPPAATRNIRRPPNAYILFSQEWRKAVAASYPEERNVDISKR
jgi:hypothetical protein